MNSLTLVGKNKHLQLPKINVTTDIPIGFYSLIFCKLYASCIRY